MRLSSLCLKLVLLAGAVCGASSAFATTNIVVNGSFQDNQLPANESWAYLSSVTGWTSTGPFEIEKGNNAGGWPSFNPTDNGNQYLEIDSTELTTVSQDLHTTKGTSYDLSFQYSGRSDTPGQASSEMAVYWNGTLLKTITEPYNSGWVTFTFDNLVATGANTELSFKALGPTSAPSYGNYLDNVVVTGVPAVPEASSFGMLALGLAFVTYTVRRRRQ